MGRPSKYDPKFHPQVVKWMARHGLTDDEIADELDIVRSTFYKWKNDFPEFSDSLKESKELPNSKIQDSLYKRALGYEYDEIETYYDKDGNESSKIKLVHVKPDVTAQIFFLKNRMRNEYRDVQHIKDETDRTELLEEIREIAENFRKEQNEK